jgi:regulator of cell morphogenesis and NO signaling
MALIYSDTRLSDVILHEPSVIPVINRFGINLGTGDLTVEAICNAHKLDVNFFLTILNTFINEGYFPEETLRGFNASKIIGYLIKTNNYYRQFQLPNIRRHFTLLINSANGENNNLELMMKFYNGLDRDIEQRIEFDSNRWFPSILAMERGEQVEPCEYEVSTMIEDKLSDLKSMFIKHLSGDYDLNLCYGVIIAIITLEKDIRQNNRIRNRILLPVSLALREKTSGKS